MKNSAVIRAAADCRNRLGLESTEPIYDICGLLENSGIKVLQLRKTSDSFFGLSVSEEDGGPAIIVNIWDRISIERQIFSAAHELGHLILHLNTYSSVQTEEVIGEEAEANLFAGHFLMPNGGFYAEWENASGLHWIDRVLKVKCVFNVSYKAVLSRLIELEMANETIWRKFNIAFKVRFNRGLAFKEEPMAIDSSEPFGLKSFDFKEERFSRLVREAIEKDKISLSRGAEMLGIGIEDMLEILKNWGNNT